MVCANPFSFAAAAVIFLADSLEVIGLVLEVSGRSTDIACESSCIFADHCGFAAAGGAFAGAGLSAIEVIESVVAIIVPRANKEASLMDSLPKLVALSYTE